MSIREEALAFMREYYDAGHIVGLNADVMANKLADRLENNQAHSILQIYTDIDLVRVVLQVHSVQIQPAGLVIGVNAPHRNCLLTNEQLADAISITHYLIVCTAPSNPRYTEICEHFTDLIKIQKERAK